jgi:oligopeptide/dipeptide ABC transporter ATP-binding protein
MYAGTICEIAETDEIFNHPAHPYTRALLSASSLSRHGTGLDLTKFRKEEVPNDGCPLAPRCTFARDNCSTATLKKEVISPGREVSCVRINEILEGIG